MDEPTNHGMVKELHEDLARKYKTIGPRVETIWRSFDKGKRTRCLKAGAEDGVVLRHPLDPALGNVCKFMPEWNLRDIAEPGSDFLLHLLRHRATKSLYEQYCEGANGAPGDRDLIIDMMLTRNLRHVDSFKDCFTIFLDNDQYGMSSRMVSHHAETLAKLQPAIQAGVCVPQSTGELILMRQLYLLQSLNILVEDILDQGSQTRDRKDRPKKPDDAATAALSKLAIDTPSAQPTLPDLMASARDQRDSLEDYLTLLCSEPVVLAHAVNMSFFGRPELVADEKGRRLPVHTDKYTSAAFFDVIHGAIKAAAIWKYIAHLLELLESSASDKVYRAIVLQEISNICHLEYSRAQAIFRQYVQTCTGAKWFRRASNGLDSVGNPRVTMKGDPEELTRADPQLHYMLRLCQTDTNASKAVGWLTKLSELHAAHPAEREKLLPAEADSLSDLAVIVAFIQDLSPAVSMPSFSRKKRQAFVARSQGLEAELNQLKKQVDLRDFAVPIDNLLEPGMADKALRALDQFVVEKSGTKLGFLYQDLVEECFSDLQSQHQRAKAKMEQESKMEWTPLPASDPQPSAQRVEQRRDKEKTRPSHSSIYEIQPDQAKPSTAAAEAAAAPPETFRVGSSTAEVFSTLFGKSQSRGSVNWVAFEAAMAELGFSVMPKYGSVYTFQPPESLTIRRPFTVHRPHTSRIEGYLILIVARRLKRVYGWGERTFEISDRE